MLRIVSDSVNLTVRTDLNNVAGGTLVESSYASTPVCPGFNTSLDNLTAGIVQTSEYMPQKNPGFDQNNNYRLLLSDAGKFVRTTWDYTSNVYIKVPTDSQVNFPIGTVITLVNMWDFNDTYRYMHVQSEQDTYGVNARVYLNGQNKGYSYSWGIKGVSSATLMKVGTNEWLLTGDCDNTD